MTDQRRVLVGMETSAGGQPRRTWVQWKPCGHQITLPYPGPGHFIAVGNSDPCPECEGGQVPQEIPNE